MNIHKTVEEVKGAMAMDFAHLETKEWENILAYVDEVDRIAEARGRGEEKERIKESIRRNSLLRGCNGCICDAVAEVLNILTPKNTGEEIKTEDKQ